MFYKWALISIAAGICVFYGYMVADRLKRREQSISDFVMFFSSLKNEMAYSRRDIEEALRWLMPAVNKRMGTFIAQTLKELAMPNTSIKIAFENGIEHCMDSHEMYFDHEDVLVILNAAVMLGTTDYEGQEQVLSGAIEQLKIKMYSAKDISIKKGQLYKKLGIFTCAAVIIVFL